MRQFELIAPCHFGMESVVKNEIYEIGYDITEVTDYCFATDVSRIFGKGAITNEHFNRRPYTAKK